jgi:hypothetical protein
MVRPKPPFRSSKEHHMPTITVCEENSASSVIHCEDLPAAPADAVAVK